MHSVSDWKETVWMLSESLSSANFLSRILLAEVGAHGNCRSCGSQFAIGLVRSARTASGRRGSLGRTRRRPDLASPAAEVSRAFAEQRSCCCSQNRRDRSASTKASDP